MATTSVGGVNIVHEIVGSAGPVIALMPGARRGAAEMKPLAERIAAEGFRVFLHDRRNTGASDMALTDTDTEEAVWADELHGLLGRLGELPAYISGSSSGARTAINFALRHPEAARGLLLTRVTGGAFAARRLPQNYYRVFIDTAREGGMAAIAETDRFKEYIATNPAVRDQLLAMDAGEFIRIQENLLERFLAGADLPVMGATAEELATIAAPTVIIPGNDNTHSSVSGKAAHEMIRGSEIHWLPVDDVDVDLITWADWSEHEPEIARVFADFMRRVEQKRAA